ncbi:MAG TPA: DNA repair protein RecN [Anaerolineales bacterium]|jgi:DNA repair protein RecN (Recombination protein N)|nr:DNA repair protein RecN [Anaerolineales bacterium]
MLLELRIENFAIIDKIDLELGPGLTVFTGETGAGKSIIIDAVETLLGVRADMSIIRTGVAHSSVEATFKIMPKVREQVHQILKEEALLDDENYVTLRREFRREGRNIARVNGRTVNLAMLKGLGELLIDLHGQSEHLSLLRIKSHLHLLDRFAEAEAELDDYRENYRELQRVRTELRQLRQSEKEATRKMEMLAFQVQEIEQAGLETDEEEALKSERVRLANAENLAKQANIALVALDEGELDSASASDRLGIALQALEDLVKVDQEQAEFLSRVQELFDGAVDLARDLSGYLQEIEFEPERLEEVEERLNLIYSLKRKYGETISEILAFGAQAQEELDAITHAEERMQTLISEEKKLLKLLAEKALAVSAKRHQASEQLSKEIEGELKDLRMDEAKFSVSFSTSPDPRGLPIPDGSRVAFDQNGFEQVEFLVAPNLGEGMKPLVKIASGGETSRLMLALKNVLARADHTPTLIFDEIDQGIGGRVGAVVGEKLWNLAKEHQVLCITHLAQLAGYGDRHFKVEKSVTEGRTVTVVANVTDQDRLVELAQMLGDVSEGTLQSANEILEGVKKAAS